MLLREIHPSGMDTSSGNYTPNLIGTSFIAVKPSVDNPSTPSEGLIPPTGLARYHSAPSSMLANLLESDLYTPSQGSDLVQYLAHGGLAECTSVSGGRLSLKSRDKEQPLFAASQVHNLDDYPIQHDMARRHRTTYMMATTCNNHFQEHIGQAPLSAILEHGGEDTMVSRPIQQSPREQGPMLAPSADFSGLLPVKSSLIRHSSLPADFVSRLVTDDVNEGPLTQRVSPHVRTPPRLRADDNIGSKVFLLSSSVSPRAVPIMKNYAEAHSSGQADVCSVSGDELKHGDLLRQSSSPAGMLSQLSLDEASNGSEKVNVLCPVGRSSVQGVVHGVGGSEWDEDAMDAAMQKIAVFSQRKRGRNSEARLYKGVLTADILMGSVDSGSCAPSILYPAVGTGNAETDSVLCKSRAKRGCATHPRSIAERVRRTKISERIKKLQDLVPNLDKQAHMADMLDEVVEYVKLLQKQVQELSRHAPECNGMCQKVENRGP